MLGVVLLLVLGVVLPVVIVVVLSVTLMVTLWLVETSVIHEILAPRGHGDQPSAARHSSVGDGHGAELASRQLIPCRRTHSSAQPLLNEQERHRQAHLQARLLVAETLAL